MCDLSPGWGTTCSDLPLLENLLVEPSSLSDVLALLLLSESDNVVSVLPLSDDESTSDWLWEKFLYWRKLSRREWENKLGPSAIVVEIWVALTDAGRFDEVWLESEVASWDGAAELFARLRLFPEVGAGLLSAGGEDFLSTFEVLLAVDSAELSTEVVVVVVMFDLTFTWRPGPFLLGVGSSTAMSPLSLRVRFCGFLPKSTEDRRLTPDGVSDTHDDLVSSRSLDSRDRVLDVLSSSIASVNTQYTSTFIQRSGKCRTHTFITICGNPKLF